MTSLDYVTVASCVGNAHCKPLAILLGGVPATGKTSVAIQLASFLCVEQVISTDYVRELMRLYESPQSKPFLFVSSFEAWKLLGERSPSNALLGWSNSRAAVAPAIWHLIMQEFQRKRDVIVEGTLVPPLESCPPQVSSLGNILYVIFTADADERKRRLDEKTRDSRGAPVDRWYDNIDLADSVQEALVKEASDDHYEVIANRSIKETVRRISAIPIRLTNVS